MRLSGAGFGIIASRFAERRWRIRAVLKMDARPLFLCWNACSRIDHAIEYGEHVR